MAEGTTSTLTWRGSLDISKANSLYEELASALEAGGLIELEAERVDRADTSIVQLFCAFFREAHERSIEVKWKSISDSLLNTARMLDLVTALELPEASPPTQVS